MYKQISHHYHNINISKDVEYKHTYRPCVSQKRRQAQSTALQVLNKAFIVRM